MSEYLVVLSKPVPGRDEEFNNWYTERHLGDVLALDGFVAARRFRFIPSRLTRQEPPAYMAIYEVAEGQRELAERSLLAALRGQGEDGMELSDALDPELITWWYEAITPRVET